MQTIANYRKCLLFDKPVLWRAYFLLAILVLPAAVFINNELIWDDQYVYATHAHWAFKSLLGPYAINSSSYWRPFTVITIAIPSLLGFPVWFGKLTNLLLFLLQGCIALAIADWHLKTGVYRERGFLLYLLAIPLGIHPVFAETSLWISARADLLLGLFAVFAVWRLMRLWHMQQLPASLKAGLLESFLVTLCICTSKETGIIWASMLLLATLVFSYRSPPERKRYWRWWSLGVLTSMAFVVIARFWVLGHPVGLDYMYGGQAAISLADRLGVMSEFMVRSGIAFMMPFLDQSPFKTSGWLPIPSVYVALVILTAVTLSLFIMARWLFKRYVPAGWLALIAVVPVLGNAILTALMEQSYGSLLANRYLAPSVALLFISFVLAISQPLGKTGGGNRGEHTLIRGAAGLYFLIVAQSLLTWFPARAAWSTNLELWESSWVHHAYATVVARNYSSALVYAAEWEKASRIATNWIDSHPQDSQVMMCPIYDSAIKADLKLGKTAEAVRLAGKAIDIGWCSPALAQNIAFLLLKKQCSRVLPMLDRTWGEGEKPGGIWTFESSAQKEPVAAMRAFANERCGSRDGAVKILEELAKENPDWKVDGKKAQGLLLSAHAE